MKRIEVEDLQPGDEFEYELDDPYDSEAWKRTGKVTQRWTTKPARDVVRRVTIRPMIIRDSVTSPDPKQRGGWFLPADAPDHCHLVPATDPRFANDSWNKPPSLNHAWAEPGQLFENAVYLLTEKGETNHGYVRRKPKDVVILHKRNGEEI